MPGKEFKTMQIVKNAPTIDEGLKQYHNLRDDYKKERIKTFADQQV